MSFVFKIVKFNKTAMGNIAAKVTKRVMRPFKNFAVEARTERILAKAKEKPTSAPWHPTTQKKIDEIIKSMFLVFTDFISD